MGFEQGRQRLKNPGAALRRSRVRTKKRWDDNAWKKRDKVYIALLQVGRGRRAGKGQ
jgi:hypothetical protein